MNLKELNIKGKIFCISMQRSGTSSVGFFLEKWGLKHLVRPTLQKKLLNWTAAALKEEHEKIIESDVFKEYEVFEDDPFWVDGFYKILHKEVPGSKFILLDRDPNSWFLSMIRHSKGYTNGIAEKHAKLYKREEELNWLKKFVPDFDVRKHKMSLFDKPQHYMNIYTTYNENAKRYFENNDPEALFYGSLSDKNVWKDVAQWLNLPELDEPYLTHKHKAKDPMSVNIIDPLSKLLSK